MMKVGAEQSTGKKSRTMQMDMQTPSGVAPSTHQPTILIVENEISNCILIEKVLSTRGFRCLSASNGREALDIVDHEAVDLILTDLSMPILDGYRTTQLIRARPALAQVPIVAVIGPIMRDVARAFVEWPVPHERGL